MDNYRFWGAMLRLMRQERSWSQGMLCKDICTVSYLSKIEQGKAEANEDLLRRLFERLDMPWQTDVVEEGSAICERLYDMIFSNDVEQIEQSKEYGILRQEGIALGTYYLDYLVLRAYCLHDRTLLSDDLLPLLSARQKALVLMLEGRTREALNIYPSALTAYREGMRLYKADKYADAIEHLRYSNEMAAGNGYVRLMMRCQFYLGDCYAILRNEASMRSHYTVARRIAQAFGEIEYVKIIDYNMASFAVENGRYEEGYRYFSNIENLSVLDAHKLAICCEKLGRRVEALAMLNSVKENAEGVQEQMCEIVRFRLKNKDYLDRQEYGKLLMDTFHNIQKTLPVGYARFHLPWVEEWCIANRQYKVIYEIMRSFPD